MISVCLSVCLSITSWHCVFPSNFPGIGPWLEYENFASLRLISPLISGGFRGGRAGPPPFGRRTDGHWKRYCIMRRVNDYLSLSKKTQTPVIGSRSRGRHPPPCLIPGSAPASQSLGKLASNNNLGRTTKTQTQQQKLTIHKKGP